MDVQRQVERLADLGRATHRLVTPERETADLRMALHAAHQVSVLAGRPHGIVDRDAVGPIEFGVVMPFQATHGQRKGKLPRHQRGGQNWARNKPLKGSLLQANLHLEKATASSTTFQTDTPKQQGLLNQRPHREGLAL